MFAAAGLGCERRRGAQPNGRLWRATPEQGPQGSRSSTLSAMSVRGVGCARSSCLALDDHAPPLLGSADGHEVVLDGVAEGAGEALDGRELGVCGSRL